MRKQIIWLSVLLVLIIIIVWLFIFLWGNDTDDKLLGSNTVNNPIVIKGKSYSLTWNNLNIEWAWIIDDEVEKIISEIKKSNSLEVLYFWQNKITSKWLSYLSDLKNNKIKVIDLSNNKTWDDWMKEFLSKNSFKVVDVSGNYLTDKSVKDIVNNTKTTYLTINRNNIWDDGFKNIFKNKNIEYLSIESNLLTDKSVNYLSSNTGSIKVKFLRIKRNNFSTGSIEKLSKLKKSKIFKKLEY